MEALGINYITIFFYLISFVIALFVLNKYVFSKISAIMTEREAEIANALNEKDNIQLKLVNADKEASEIIKVAKISANEILEEAKNDIEPHKNQILKEAELEKIQIIQGANKEAGEIIVLAHHNARRDSNEILESVINKAVMSLGIDDAAANNLTSKIIDKI